MAKLFRPAGAAARLGWVVSLPLHALICATREGWRYICPLPGVAGRGTDPCLRAFRRLRLDDPFAPFAVQGMAEGVLGAVRFDAGAAAMTGNG